MTLTNDIAQWDRRSAAAIRRVYQQHSGRAAFSQDLLGMLPVPQLADGASWLLKHFLEDGQTLSAGQWTEMTAALPTIQTWPARLHLLQIASFWPPRLRSPVRIERFVRDSLDHDRNLVRVWALHAFFEFAVRIPACREEVRQRIQDGQKNGSAALKARIRHLKHREFPG